jgi:hypothetical protein
MCACVRASSHTPSPESAGLHISVPISRPIVYSCRIQTLSESDLPKTEGVEGITGLRTPNGVEIPMREGRRRIYFPVDQTVKRYPQYPYLFSLPLMVFPHIDVR